MGRSPALHPRDVLGAMEKQMRAERDKRAQNIDAEGSKRAAVLQAEGSGHSKPRFALDQSVQAIGQEFCPWNSRLWAFGWIG